MMVIGCLTLDISGSSICQNGKLFWRTVYFCVIFMLTIPLFKFVSLHIGSNYLDGLARSLKMETIFLVSYLV